MGNILDRFALIMKSNINVMLDKMEGKDPMKVVDQILIEKKNDLAEVRRDTAEVRNAAKKAAARLQEQEDLIAKYDKACKAAAELATNNPDDATIKDELRQLIAKKQSFEAQLPQLQDNKRIAADRADKMNQLHAKLASDIEQLEARRETLVAQVAILDAKKISNKYANGKSNSAADEAFARMEQKVEHELGIADELSAMAEEEDANEHLVDKYAGPGASGAVDDEMAKYLAAASGTAE